ncbi:MAG: starch phosphorylase [Cryomorphaceae bacterium]
MASVRREIYYKNDMLGFYQLMVAEVLPLCYGNKDGWWDVALNSMDEVVPFFDSERMADEYYKNIYN